MSLRFRRSVGLFPGIKLNLNTGLPSLSVGEKDAHVTFGAEEVTFGTSLPGSGLSFRERIRPALFGEKTNKPQFWEFTLLQKGLSMVLEDSDSAWLDATEVGMDPSSFCFWISNRVEILEADMACLMKYLTSDLTDALGPIGKPGSETKLVQIIESVGNLIDELIGWEQEIKAFSNHPIYGELANALSGFSLPLIEGVREVKEKLDLQIPYLQKGGNLNLSFTLQAPSGAALLQQKLKELETRPLKNWKLEVRPMSYKVARGADQLGVFNQTTIKENLLAGIFLADDWYWDDSIADWSPLSEFFIGMK